MVTELFEEFESDFLCVEDFDIHYNGALITHIALNDEGKVTFWSGSPDPDDDEHAVELLIDEKTAKEILKEIDDLF